MKDTALKWILDREIPVNAIKHHVKEPCRKLRKLVDEATKLFGRLSGQKGSPALKSALMTFRHILEMADAISVMVESSVVVPARLQLRSEFEGLLTLLYLFEDKELVLFRDKCLIYCYWMTRQQQYLGFERLTNDPKTLPEVKKISLDFLKYHQESRMILQKYLDDPKFNDIRDLVKASGKRYPNWYSLNRGPANLHDLATRVGREAHYITTYGLFSQVTHSLDFDRQILLVDGEEVIRPLRDCTEFPMTFALAKGHLFSAMLCLIKFYRPEEETRFLENNLALMAESEAELQGIHPKY